MTIKSTNSNTSFPSQPRREIDLPAAYRIIISAWLLRQKPAFPEGSEERQQSTPNKQ